MGPRVDPDQSLILGRKLFFIVYACHQPFHRDQRTKASSDELFALNSCPESRLYVPAYNTIRCSISRTIGTINN